MNQLLMHLSELSDLPPIPFLNDGMQLRIATSADASELASLLAAAFAPTHEWDVDRVNAELLECADVPTSYIISDCDAIVATASVLLRADQALNAGYLHWVAVNPSWQGQGLGYVVSLAVLHELARLGRSGASLKTDDHRLAAIKTYLKLGFVGVCNCDEDVDRWARISLILPSVGTEQAS